MLALRLAINPIFRQEVLKLILSPQLPSSQRRQGHHSSRFPRPRTIFAAYNLGLQHHLYNLGQDFIDVALVCDDARLSKAQKDVLAKYI